MIGMFFRAWFLELGAHILLVLGIMVCSHHVRGDCWGKIGDLPWNDRNGRESLIFREDL